MKIQIFTTGGTIDKVYFDAASKYEVGESVVSVILHEAKVSFVFEVTEVCKKDSLDLTEADRHTIHAGGTNCEAEHILITRGSDNMTDPGEVTQDVAHNTTVIPCPTAAAR